MKWKQLLVISLMSIALQSLAMADENGANEPLDPAAQCDKAYEACVQKCDASGEGAPECYTACDDASEKCYTLAQDKE